MISLAPPPFPPIPSCNGGPVTASLPKPLSESSLAELLAAIRTINAVGNRLDAVSGVLQHYRIPFDVQSFRRLQGPLSALCADLDQLVIAHLDALDKTRAGRP